MSLFGSWELAMTIEITTPFVKSSAIKKLYRCRNAVFAILNIFVENYSLISERREMLPCLPLHIVLVAAHALLTLCPL